MDFLIDHSVLEKYNSNDEIVFIPDGVTKIGEGAFQNNTSIKEVHFSSTVQSVWENAFRKCTSLEKVVFNEGITYIGEGAFDHCEMLNNVVIPNSVTIISAWAFDGCTSLSNCSLSENLKSCDESAFKGCPFYDAAEQKRITNLESKRIEEASRFETPIERRKKAQLKLLKEQGKNGYWEYKVIDIIDKRGGVNISELSNTLNDLGRQGWHLVCAYSNELGKNSLSVAGIGVNASVDQNILLLERFIEFESETE